MDAELKMKSGTLLTLTKDMVDCMVRHATEKPFIRKCRKDWVVKAVLLAHLSTQPIHHTRVYGFPGSLHGTKVKYMGNTILVKDW